MELQTSACLEIQFTMITFECTDIDIDIEERVPTGATTGAVVGSVGAEST